jgi:hypothetical protein
MIFSVFTGAGIAGGNVAYQKMKYYAEVNEGYYIIKERLARHPQLMNFKESDDVLKNFGTNVYNELGESDITNDYLDTFNNAPGVFEGTEEDERKDTRKRIYDSLFN